MQTTWEVLSLRAVITVHLPHSQLIIQPPIQPPIQLCIQSLIRSPATWQYGSQAHWYSSVLHQLLDTMLWQPTHPCSEPDYQDSEDITVLVIRTARTPPLHRARCTEPSRHQCIAGRASTEVLAVVVVAVVHMCYSTCHCGRCDMIQSSPGSSLAALCMKLSTTDQGQR